MLRRGRLGVVAIGLSLMLGCDPFGSPQLSDERDLRRYRGPYTDETFLLRPGGIRAWASGEEWGILETRRSEGSEVDAPPAVVLIARETNQIEAILEAVPHGEGPAFGVLWHADPANSSDPPLVGGYGYPIPFFNPLAPDTTYCYSSNADDCPTDGDACHCHRGLRFTGPRTLANIDWSCDVLE